MNPPVSAAAQPAPRPAARPRPADPMAPPRWTRPREPGTGAQVASMAVLVVIVGVLLWAGWPYYRLAPGERLHSEWHAVLKPSGTVGLLYGYIGTGFLLVLLAYSVRKRFAFLRPLGALSRWLDVHIVCGLAGPAFITLHSSLRFNGLIVIGYVAMLCVMVSGLLGYYLYRQIPGAIRRGHGRRQSVEAAFASMDDELRHRFGLTEEHLQRLRRIAGVEQATRLGPLASLPFLVFQDLTLDLRLLPMRFRDRAMRRLGRRETRRLRRLVRRRVLLDRRIAFLHQTQVLFGYWHAFHRPFAVVLYLIMAVHIGVAFWLGYAWIWG